MGSDRQLTASKLNYLGGGSVHGRAGRYRFGVAANQITGKTARSGREKGGDNRAAGESVAAVERRYMMNAPGVTAALSVKIRMAYK